MKQDQDMLVKILFLQDWSPEVRLTFQVILEPSSN